MTVKTIDEAIASLEAIRNKSPLGGGTCLVICRSGFEDESVTKIQLVADQDGAVVLLSSETPRTSRHKWIEETRRHFRCGNCGMTKRHPPQLFGGNRHYYGAPWLVNHYGEPREVLAPQTSGGVRTTVPPCPGPEPKEG